MPDWGEDVEVMAVEVYGGPYDGGVLHVPMASDGTYGSATGATPLWPGLPVRERSYASLINSTSGAPLILDWFDLTTSAIVFPECRALVDKLKALTGLR